MPDMRLTKYPIPTQSPEERVTNYSEVALGYDADTAVKEAARCLNCKNKPCVSGCPVGIRIPDFIAAIREQDFDKAYAIIREDSALPAVCGRVCPQESQCEGKCVRGIKGESVAIGRLERFAADWARGKAQMPAKPEKKLGRRVAVVGSGPAGLSCAGTLLRAGCDVTIFEALHEAGGVLIYGIPEFRLPKAIVKAEIDGLQAMGADIRLNTIVGRTLTVDEILEDGYDAVFIGSGAGLPKFMNIPGENLNGVFSANEFLTRINLMKAYKITSHTPLYRGQRVAVVGGGNVAMDAARCARRLGAEVTVVYRRTRNELPARAEEVEHAMEEGIVFKFLTNPLSIEGDEKQHVVSMTCQRMELGEPDASGRRRPVPVPGSEETIPVDAVIMALGTSPNPLIRDTTKGLDTERWGGIIVKGPSGLTSRDKVYAGGDAVTGAATVILAMGAGKDAAGAILESFEEA
ncbi:MAG: NADPH-dependent glutamate synthase [Clostridia bacterium]|nr:NADPH-dependent glutamate synthase [Clostridia bacterium]